MVKFLIMKRSDEHAENFNNLFPFRKVAKWNRLPEDWKTVLVETYGEGEYTVSEYGSGIQGFHLIFHGDLDCNLRW